MSSKCYDYLRPSPQDVEKGDQSPPEVPLAVLVEKFTLGDISSKINVR